MYTFLVLVFASWNVLAFDVISAGKEGKNHLIYVKNGYVYVRQCPPYKVVKSRKECKATEETQMMKITALKQTLRRMALEITPTKDRDYIDWDFNQKTVTKNNLEWQKIETFRKKNGDASIDMKKYAALQVAINFENELSSTLNQIMSGMSVAYDRLDKKNLGSELIKELLLMKELTDQDPMWGALMSAPDNDDKQCRIIHLREYDGTQKDVSIKKFLISNRNEVSNICYWGAAEFDCVKNLEDVRKHELDEKLFCTVPKPFLGKVKIINTSKTAINHNERGTKKEAAEKKVTVKTRAEVKEQ